MFDCPTLVNDPKLVVVVFCCVDSFACCLMRSVNFVCMYTDTHLMYILGVALVHTNNLLFVTVMIVYVIEYKIIRIKKGFSRN